MTGGNSARPTTFGSWAFFRVPIWNLLGCLDLRNTLLR